MRNVPDDWDSYYSTCSRCGSKYHDSEGGCGCADDLVQCGGGSDCGDFDDGLIDPEEATQFGDNYYCEKHNECVCCGAEKDLAEGEDDELLCPKCIKPEHEVCAV